jgi:beta-phosphoglucomutase-like phosphatase (HAD superfamily)
MAEKPERRPFTTCAASGYARYADLLTREPLVIDGVREVLESLQGRYIQGIVTSSGHEHFEIIHRRSGLLPYFQFVLTMEGLRAFQAASRTLTKRPWRYADARRRECLVIEDSPRGLASADCAGIRAIVIPSQFTRGSAFRGPGGF